MKASRGFSTRWMTELINNLVREDSIPDDRRKSIMVHVYKGKGDPLVCGSNRAIKLLDQPMKVLERVLEKRIRCQVSIDNMQFMPGKRNHWCYFHHATGTRDTPNNEEEAVLCFCGFGKGINRVSREVVRWAMRKLGVNEWLLLLSTNSHNPC